MKITEQSYYTTRDPQSTRGHLDRPADETINQQSS